MIPAVVSTNDYINLSEAQKLASPLDFSTMVKPVGSACNLNCRYCYYSGKADLYGNMQPKMSEELLELYVRQYIEAVEAPEVSFCWHGGEPLLAGLDFYKKAIAFQNKYCNGKKISNSLQTNELLINDGWCNFFRDNNFLIGISIDGPQHIHDANRLYLNRQPSFEKVLNSIELMFHKGVEYNTLCAINSRSEGLGIEIYRFLRSISKFIQFLPVFEHTDKNGRIVSPSSTYSKPTPYSVSPSGFGQFMIDVFDEWIRHDVGETFVQLFDITLSQWYGRPSTLCAFSETCGDGLVVEHNGDVYCCDHFVYPEYKLGNIKNQPLAELRTMMKQFRFGMDKRDALPTECQNCEYLFLCHGECPKHRFATTNTGEHGLNSLCEGYKMFFGHTEPYMKKMCELLDKNQAPAEIMRIIQAVSL